MQRSIAGVVAGFGTIILLKILAGLLLVWTGLSNSTNTGVYIRVYDFAFSVIGGYVLAVTVRHRVVKHFVWLSMLIILSAVVSNWAGTRTFGGVQPQWSSFVWQLLVIVAGCYVGVLAYQWRQRQAEEVEEHL